MVLMSQMDVTCSLSVILVENCGCTRLLRTIASPFQDFASLYRSRMSGEKTLIDVK